MLAIRRTAALIAAVVVLGGCTMAGQGTDRDTGDRSDSGSQTASTRGGGSGSSGEMRATQLARNGAIPSLGTSVFEPQDLPQFETTGTFVGQKVQELRGDLDELKQQISDHNQRLQQLRQQTREAARTYHSNVARINTRLQLGTTPGNPELVRMWNQARQRLGTVEQTVNEMNQLSNKVSSTARLASYLLESVQAAYGLSGAVEKDHEQLAVLEDSTNRTVVLIDRLANELSSDISRQNNYLQRERANLSTLSLAIKNGEFYGEPEQPGVRVAEPAEPVRRRRAGGQRPAAGGDPIRPGQRELRAGALFRRAPGARPAAGSGVRRGRGGPAGRRAVVAGAVEGAPAGRTRAALAERNGPAAQPRLAVRHHQPARQRQRGARLRALTRCRQTG
ncbi:MAG: hypothetical protein U5L06_09850 [Rhodovibrio sp.]|nr:hypothetical protein [Rhodovibrio sp.]